MLAKIFLPANYIEAKTNKTTQKHSLSISYQSPILRDHSYMPSTGSDIPTELFNHIYSEISKGDLH